MIESGKVATLFRIAPIATGISEKRNVEDKWVCYSDLKGLWAPWQCLISALSWGDGWFAELSQEHKLHWMEIPVATPPQASCSLLHGSGDLTQLREARLEGGLESRTQAVHVRVLIVQK